MLFVSTAFTIFTGTVFPILSEGLTGTKITVGPPFFDQVAGPQMIVLVLLMGIAPLMAWAKANARALGRMAVIPLIIGIVATAALMACRPPADCAGAGHVAVLLHAGADGV